MSSFKLICIFAFCLLSNKLLSQYPPKKTKANDLPAQEIVDNQAKIYAEALRPSVQLKAVQKKIYQIPQQNPNFYVFKHKSKGPNDFDAQATHFEMRVYDAAKRSWSDATHVQFLKDILNDTISSIVFKFGADSQGKHMQALQNAYKNVELGYIQCDSLWGRPALSYTVKCEIYNNEMLKLVKKTVITGKRYIVFYDQHMIDLWWHGTPDDNRWDDVAKEQLRLMNVILQ